MGLSLWMLIGPLGIVVNSMGINHSKFFTTLEQHNASKKNKFFTTLEDHERSKWGFPDPEHVGKTSVVDPQWLNEWMETNGPYLYHGTHPEATGRILNDGLLPHDYGENSRSQWDGEYVRPRPNHVYLGTHQYASTYARPGSQLLRVDLRKLNPNRINADEDHFIDDTDHPVVKEVYEFSPPPSQEEWADYHGHNEDDRADLGKWAEQEQLGAKPEETHYSLGRGSVAYDGPVPPEAIDLAPPDAHATWALQRSNPNSPMHAMDEWANYKAAATKPLYHWTDASKLDTWLNPSEIQPKGAYLTETGDDPSQSWNPDIPYYERPVRLSIDPDKLDPNLFGFDHETGEGYQNGAAWGNHYYKGIIPRHAITEVKPYRAPDAWDSFSEPDVQFGNDYGLTVGAKVAEMEAIMKMKTDPIVLNEEQSKRYTKIMQGRIVQKVHPNFNTGLPCTCGFDHTKWHHG